jgi:hypothetical protein
VEVVDQVDTATGALFESLDDLIAATEQVAFGESRVVSPTLCLS